MIPVTRFKEMEEGETGYPMAREDRETAVTEGGRWAWGPGSVSAPGVGGRGGTAGGISLADSGPARTQKTHPPEKEEGGAGAIAARRAGLCSGPGADTAQDHGSLTLQVVPSHELEEFVEPDDWQ